MQTSTKGRKFIEGYEGLILHTYNDGVGVPTIGYGHTSSAGPPAVHYGQKITAAEADAILAVDLGKVEAQVRSRVKVPLNQDQWDVLVSFTFNCGPGNLDKLIARSGLNTGKYDLVPVAMMRHIYGRGGVKMQGLINRRTAEGRIWRASGASPTVHVPHPSPVRTAPTPVQAPSIVPDQEPPSDQPSLFGGIKDWLAKH